MNAKVINLPKRTDKWENIQNSFQTSLSLERVDAYTTNRPPAQCLFLQHRQLLTEAQQQGKKYLLVLEDDAVRQPEFDTRWKQIQTYLEQNPDWDIFNGGMLNIAGNIQHIQKLQNPTTLVLNVNGGICGHFLYFKVETCLEKLKDWEKDGMPMFDLYYPEKLKCITCLPYLASQADGYSDLWYAPREWQTRFKYEEMTMMFKLRKSLIE